MKHQYKKNGARNMYSDYNQMRANVECSPNQSTKILLCQSFHRAIDETLKIPETCRSFLYLNLPEYNFAV